MIYGWGINDVDYVVKINEEMPKRCGKRSRRQVWVCPYYRTWKSMIERCFSNKYHEKSPTYKGCTVHEDWRYLSNFIKWVDSQPNKEWENCQLDKDFLSLGNKLYCPETCVFISNGLNKFITDRSNHRGTLMIGVSYSNSKKNPFQATCCNPFNNKRDYLGVFQTELEAHLAWKKRKHELALRLANIQSDVRVADRLRNMYTSDIDLTSS